ncbi:MAG TPA: VWA domain-containing protein [Caldisericia bacterium]|nr:VWA domain-containing protein [Caldisericia bacterium]
MNKIIKKVFVFLFIIFFTLETLLFSVSAVTTVVVDNSKVAISEIIITDYPKVKVTVSVVDRNNEPVENLTINDFKVYENGIKRKIISVRSLKGTKPLSIIMLLDISGSMQGEPIEELKNAAMEFIRLMPNNWKVQLIQFNEYINDVYGGFISNKTELISTISQISAGGATNLHNALGLSYNISKQTKESDAIIIFSDGVDTMNVAGSREKAINGSLSCKAPIYSIGYLGYNPQFGSIDEDLLKTISSNTRGRFYKTPSLNEINELYQRISRILNNQYEIIYVSEAEGKKGEGVNVRVANLDKETNEWIYGDRDYNLPKEGINVPILLVHGWNLISLKPFSPIDCWKDYISYFSIDPASNSLLIGKEEVGKFTDVIFIDDTNVKYGEKHMFWKMDMNKVMKVKNKNFNSLKNKVIYISNYSLITDLSILKGTHKSITTYAKNLADEVAMIIEKEKVKNIDIIAHSMGGLVARTYIECGDFDLKLYDQSKPVPVRRLIMLGTPNHGVLKNVLDNYYYVQNHLVNLTAEFLESYLGLKRVESYSDIKSTAVEQLVTNSEFLNILNYGKKIPPKGKSSELLNPDVHYVTIAGIAPLGLDTLKNMISVSLDLLLEKYLKGEGSDGFIRSDSVYLAEADQYYFLWSDHSGLRTRKEVFKMVKDIQRYGYLKRMQDYWIDLKDSKVSPIYDYFTPFLGSPATLIISDEKGNKIDSFGLISSEKKIKDAFYDFETNSFTIINPKGSYAINVLGTGKGFYTLSVFGRVNKKNFFYEAKKVPVKKGQLDIFTINSSALENGVKIKKDLNADGVTDKEYVSPPNISKVNFSFESPRINLDWDASEEVLSGISRYNLYEFNPKYKTPKIISIPKTKNSFSYRLSNPSDYRAFAILTVDKENSWNQSLTTNIFTQGELNELNSGYSSSLLTNLVNLSIKNILITFFVLILVFALVILIVTSLQKPKEALILTEDGTIIPIKRTPFTIGRMPDCNIKLDNLEVSRMHAEIINKGNQFVINDLNSRNGVFVNGKKVKSKLLQDNDQIKIGKNVFTFKLK